MNINTFIISCITSIICYATIMLLSVYVYHWGLQLQLWFAYKRSLSVATDEDKVLLKELYELDTDAETDPDLKVFKAKANEIGRKLGIR